MGFRENLKSELDYSGLSVKELAAQAGLQKRAIDNYLRTADPAIPPVDAAVKMARALGVTVERLVLGDQSSASAEIQRITRKLGRVGLRDRRLIADLLDSMIERQEGAPGGGEI